MASKTKRTELVRKTKRSRSTKSKVARRNQGTTKSPKTLFGD